MPHVFSNDSFLPEGTGKTGLTNNKKTFGYYAGETYVAIVDGMAEGVENVVSAIEHPFQTIGNAAIGAVATVDIGVNLLMFDRETNAMINEAVVGYVSNNSYQEIVKDASSLATSSYLGAAAGSTALNVAKTSGLTTAVNYNVSKALNAVDDVASGTNETVQTTALQTYYPPNDGFLGEAIDDVLQPGTMVDRYGYPGGSYVAPVGTPAPMRALPPGTLDKPYNVYEVVEAVNVKSGPAAPWFGQTGLGTQYKFDSKIIDLLEAGILKEMK